MPRILIVIARLNLGGTSRYIEELVAGLLRNGYEVLVATGQVQGAEMEYEIMKSIQIRRISHLGRKVSPINDLRARSQIKKVINEYEPDLIYSHTFKAGALVRSFENRIPVVHAFHGHLLNEPELQGWKSRLVILIERKLALRSNTLVTVGKQVSNELLEQRIGKVEQYISIAPGVKSLLLEERNSARRSLGIADENRPVIVWMARVTAVKAPHRVAEIARKIPEARFLLAGGGDLIDAIAIDVPENLTILGWQPAKRMWAVADLAISTSENEGMPLALIEAQLSGIPVVAVDVGSVGEIVEDGETGYTCEYFGDEFIDRVRELVLDKGKRVQMSGRAKLRASQEFDCEKFISSHIKMFQKILK